MIPNEGNAPLEVGLGRMAEVAETAGAESLWVSDHLLMVDSPASDYPYAADGRPDWSTDENIFEALACCSYIAAATRRCRIGTAVLVLPQRNVFEVAKSAATIDRLSNGRLVLGIGAGWQKAEFQTLGYSFSDRGKRLDEMIDVLRDCWTGRPRARHGDLIEVPPNIVLHPRPAQDKGPPLIIGGMSRAALRRAAVRGAGWLALGFIGSFNAAEFASKLETVRMMRRESGDTNPFEAILKLHAPPSAAGDLPRVAQEAQRIGFDTLVIEPPWEQGADAGAHCIAAVRDRLSSLE